MARLRHLLVLLPVFVLSNANVKAQDPVYERILLPITLARPVPGAYGSVWATEIKVHASGGPVRFRQFSLCFACLPIYDVAPNATVDLPVGRAQGQPLGTIIYLDRDTAANAQLNLRVSDLSRQSATWGTELPVVRERDFVTAPLTLINIPTDARFRQALRIYDVDSNVGTIFRVQIYDDRSGQLLVDDSQTVQPSPIPGEMSWIPSIVELTSLLTTYPQLTSAERIRVVVTPLTVGTRFWAFVSVTNNETQHVTIISPQ